MKNKIITTIITIVSIFGLTAAISLPVGAASVCDLDQSKVSAEVWKANGCDSSSPTIQTVITNILNAIIVVLGLVAVIFIIRGGIEYMTSAGDAGKLQKAKSTIIYAVIGLVVCVLAFAIVNFTIGILKNSNGQNNAPGNNTQSTEQSV